ncbi:MAG: metallophosphoesterase, partial [Gammaproteobacteria bacterium]|nr:metallophosphoesterase [Gammaproteobacteria bacterium]
MPEALQIALVTDIHNGKESLTKKGGMALPLLQRFGEFVDEAGPDLVLDLGDRITDVDRDTDRAALAEVAGVFERMRAPRVHLLGNHDCAFMSIEDNAELLGQGLGSSSLDLKGWHLVFWQA